MIVMHDPRPNARQRELEEMGARLRKGSVLPKGTTAASKALSDSQLKWLGLYAADRWSVLYANLAQWRAKLSRFEAMAEGDYSDRIGTGNDEGDSAESIFSKSNHSLGVVAGFADFAFAQVRDDIFGTRPWLAATPVGLADGDLADAVSKHSQWKFDQSNVETTAIDAERLAVDLGTVFLKTRYQKEIETYETVEFVAWSKSSNSAHLNEAGDYATHESELPEGTDGNDVEWREMLVTNTLTLYNNVTADTLDFKDVAFDAMAPELSLLHTDFLCRFSIGLLDAASLFGLTDDQVTKLRDLIGSGDSNPREHRGETSTDALSEMDGDDLNTNPRIYLVEGYLRCDPWGKGDPKRLHVVFSPDLETILRVDYLANVTPDGILPVYPVRCFKTPRRILGRGYYEVYESANTSIDEKWNSVNYRDRMASNPITALNVDALADESEEEDIVLGPGKTFKLKTDKKLADFIEFMTIPDANQRSVELMQQDLQMIQSRTGITSASQGELKGLPQSNTATGVNQIISRGAVLLKWPIDQIRSDIRNWMDYNVALTYANLDEDETFTWGEGQDMELVSLKADAVKGLKMNVTLTLSRSQNQEKLQTAQAAINLISSWIAIPEIEKPAARKLFIQALKSLGFNDADRIIREAVVNPQDILPMLPPDMAAMFGQFLQSMGMGPPGTPAATQPDAPVTVAAPSV